MIVAIDPGNSRSAYVRMTHDGEIVSFEKSDNVAVRDGMGTGLLIFEPGDHLAIEMIASYGMPVGKEVFETCVWVGRFIECWGGPFTLVYRRDVKLHICGQARANDANIRAALIDKFGPGKELAIGTKKAPGPLYGMKADTWSALAVAITYREKLAVAP